MCRLDRNWPSHLGLESLEQNGKAAWCGQACGALRADGSRKFNALVLLSPSGFPFASFCHDQRRTAGWWQNAPFCIVQQLGSLPTGEPARVSPKWRKLALTAAKNRCIQMCETTCIGSCWLKSAQHPNWALKLHLPGVGLRAADLDDNSNPCPGRSTWLIISEYGRSRSSCCMAQKWSNAEADGHSAGM